MKNKSSGLIIFIILMVVGWLLCKVFIGCTKEYDQHPTCFKYEQLIDRFNGERVYIRTDTSYPSGRLGYVCNDDTMMFHERPDTVGCATGYFSYRYIKQK